VPWPVFDEGNQSFQPIASFVCFCRDLLAEQVDQIDTPPFVAAADIVGIRAVVAHAKDEEARRFYEHFNFDPSPIEPMQMFLLLKEIKRLLKT
jgi:hypothetical protein